MSRDKLDKVDALMGQKGVRPVRVIDDQRVAEEAAKPWKNLVSEVQWELTQIQAVLWAADQLTLEQRDMTISKQEADSRVHCMVIVARKLVERLDDGIEAKYNSIAHPERAEVKQTA